MRTKKHLLILFTVFLSFIILLAACNTRDDESSKTDTSSVSTSSVAESKADESTVSEPTDESGDESSQDEVSLDPITNDPTEYLNILASTLTDKNCFVVVGNCEEGAVITATTAGKQSVTAVSDSGFYSVRLKKEDVKTRVKIVAKGSITEQFVADVEPVVPTSEMWPIIGGNGYQFFFQSMMPDFTQETRLSNSEVNALTEKIQSRISTLKESLPNTEIIYMIVPSKASIYPERVPDGYVKGTGKSRLEQVNEALAAGGATVIDLLDIYQEHKDDKYKIYWGTDSHWTDYGAFIAYTELFNYISERFPSAAPRKEIEFNFKGDYYNGGDMVYYMMMNQNIVREYNYYREPKFALNSDIASVPRYRAANYLMYSEATVQERVFNTNRSKLPDLYIMRDSFGAHIYDIFADRGNTTVYKGMWNFTYNLNEIKSYQPDYIIYVMTEWNIKNVLQG